MDLAQERELMEKSRKDPERFGRLFDIYYGKIYAYIFKRTAHIQASQDITSKGRKGVRYLFLLMAL